MYDACACTQVSLHPPSVMTDIKLPDWADTPELFIRWHRFVAWSPFSVVFVCPACLALFRNVAHSNPPRWRRQMLESSEVSRKLHTWIDLSPSLEWAQG